MKVQHGKIVCTERRQLDGRHKTDERRPHAPNVLLHYIVMYVHFGSVQGSTAVTQPAGVVVYLQVNHLCICRIPTACT